MIKIDRTCIPKPEHLESGAVTDLIEDARQFYRRPQAQRVQERYRFEKLHTHPQVKKSLQSLFHGKCAYCESPLTQSGFEVDLFRPADGALDLQGEFFSDHYWWLAYAWENMYPACPYCNRAKGNRFPVAAKRSRVGTTGEVLRKESPLLLDPCADNPNDDLVFSANGDVAGTSERGQVTIEVLALNRSELVKFRRLEAERLLQEWQEAVSGLATKVGWKRLVARVKQMTAPEHAYAGMRRQLIAEWTREQDLKKAKTMLSGAWSKLLSSVADEQTLIDRNARREHVAKFKAFEADQDNYTLESETKEARYFIRTRMIERIELHNFRIIDDLTFDLNHPEGDRAPWLMLLGENGTGKSSVLHALALALMGYKYREQLGFEPAKYLRHRTRSGYVRVHLSGASQPIELTMRSGSRHFEGSTGDPKVLLLGYGATRLLPRPGIPSATSTRYARVENLFNPFVPLNNAETWLLDLPDKTFQPIARVMKDLLALDASGRLQRKERGRQRYVEVRAFGDRFKLDELSDGYQSVLALATDIMAVMLERWTAMEVAEGVVLVDEIGAHLHPRWRMRIVKSLRQMFPRVQFIVSTHSPLCLRGLGGNEVAVMRRDEADRITAITDLPSVEGLRIDQLLTSEFFGLNSTIDPEIEKQFETYYALLAKPRPTSDDKQRIEALKAQLDHRDQMGSTRREREMLELVDHYLAQRPESLSEDKRKRLKSSTRRKVASLWERIERQQG